GRPFGATGSPNHRAGRNLSGSGNILVVPGTFSSLQASSQVEKTLHTSEAGRRILHTIQNPPLLVIACLFSIIALGALVWLLRFEKLRRNFSWLINKILVPRTLNATAGLLTTLISVYTSKGGDWSVMAIMTIAVTGTTLLVSATFLAVYKFYKLDPLARKDRGIRRRWYYKISSVG
ncbi:uncharacterized protein N7483_011512, partial [Penicillium malachiteum]|uniref:uncharacterized protein n=1 Tax=Penicillium malachiteum TaxID=1324776 RepID=UPI0025470C87